MIIAVESHKTKTKPVTYQLDYTQPISNNEKIKTKIIACLLSPLNGMYSNHCNKLYPITDQNGQIAEPVSDKRTQTPCSLVLHIPCVIICYFLLFGLLFESSWILLALAGVGSLIPVSAVDSHWGYLGCLADGAQWEISRQYSEPCQRRQKLPSKGTSPGNKRLTHHVAIKTLHTTCRLHSV